MAAIASPTQSCGPYRKASRRIERYSGRCSRTAWRGKKKTGSAKIRRREMNEEEIDGRGPPSDGPPRENARVSSEIARRIPAYAQSKTPTEVVGNAMFQRNGQPACNPPSGRAVAKRHTVSPARVAAVRRSVERSCRVCLLSTVRRAYKTLWG